MSQSPGGALFPATVALALLPLLLTAGCSDGEVKDTDITATDTDTDADTDTDTDTDTDPTSAAAEGLCKVEVECFGTVLDEPKVPCALSLFDSDGDFVHAGPAGLELRGRSSLAFPKPQYAVELREYTELPIWPGFPWQYLADGTDASTAWKEPGFNAASWATAPTPFGYGQNYLQTELAPDSGPDGTSATTYFRHEFTLANLANVTNVDIGIIRNDAAVIWLNGVEVYRDEGLPNMVRYDSLAPAELTFGETILWQRVDVDPALLVAGTNVVAVEIHQASVASPDMRFDMYLEATGGDQSEDLLGMGEAADWILNGQYVDRSLFRNRLAFDLFQSLGGPERFATESQFCEMELNGEYVGIYTLGEVIEADGDRLDIDDGVAPGDSFIIKNDDRGGGFTTNGSGYGVWQLEFPDADDATEAAVSAYLAEYEAAVQGANPADPNTGIFGYVDMDSAVDWVLLQEVMKNNDGYLLSVHMWRDQGGKLMFVPWDFDLSMGYPYLDCGHEGWVSRTYLDITTGQIVDIAFIQEMAQVPAFRDALVVRWNELRQDMWSDATILGLIAGYDATLEPAVGANVARWPIEDIAFETDFVDNWLCPVGSYEEEHQRTLDFLTGRLAWMDTNIAKF